MMKMGVICWYLGKKPHNVSSFTSLIALIGRALITALKNFYPCYIGFGIIVFSI